MGISYRFFSSLPPNEAIELVESCNRAIDEYLEEHPDCEDAYGEVDAELSSPQTSESTDPELVLRLERCRSAIRIDRPGDEQSPLQIAIFRFLIERMPDALFEPEGAVVSKAETFLAKLRRARGIRGFGRPAAPPPRRAPVKQRAERAGEARAVRVCQILVRAVADTELGLDLRSTLRSASELERRYAVLLLEEGAMSDAQAAKHLGVPADELSRSADALAAALARIA